MDKKQLAKAAWSKIGKPISAIDRMTVDEVEALAALWEPGGTVVEGFAGKIAAFVEKYYEDRKASHAVEPGGFGSASKKETEEPEELTEEDD